MKTVSLKLPRSLDAKLTTVARRRRASKSAVVRDALEAFFASDGRLRGVSVLDLAGDLAGCVEGPRDLSTNKKYMRGFGR